MVRSKTTKRTYGHKLKMLAMHDVAKSEKTLNRITASPVVVSSVATMIDLAYTFNTYVLPEV